MYNISVGCWMLKSTDDSMRALKKYAQENALYWQSLAIVPQILFYSRMAGGRKIMKIYSEISLENFEAWSGAADTLNRVKEEGKCDELEALLEDLYPDGMSETELNDFLWFDSDTVYEWLGIEEEEEEEND